MVNTYLAKLKQKTNEYLAYESPEVFTWCGGCGNYAIQNALKRALVLEKILPQNVVMCFDVGCNGNGSDKIEGYTIHGLHGRSVSLAAGIAIANPKLKVIASAGDGAVFNEGTNHIIHAIRSDYPILFLLHDNQNYALTTGQPSSTSPKNKKMNSAPDGVPTDPINPLEFLLSLKPSFVAQTISADINHMVQMFQKGLHHKGFALINIRQTCPTYNKECPNSWYLERIENIENLKNYNKNDIWQARKLVENTEKIPLGIIYQNKDKTPFLQTVPNRQQIKSSPVEEVRHYDISKFLKKLV